VAERLGAVTVLLGHTRDDQAETVLLGLARGSGARSLAGMAPVAGRYRRPLLALSRATTAACCAESDLTPWQDPHNDDRGFRRVRVRHDVMPVLEAALGPGVADSLARTASLLRDDDTALEVWADRLQRESEVAGLPAAGLDVAVLGAAPAAVRRRVLRRVAIAAGTPPGSLAAVHLHELDALVAEWHGQGPIVLPGGVRGERRCGRLYLACHGPVAEPELGRARE
jgi:tRNA(Ile)-lysidine synthase